MTRDEIITLALTRLGNRQGEAALITSAETEVILSQNRLEQMPELPWFLETEADLTTVAEQDYVTLPAEFIRFLSEDHSDIRLVEADGTKHFLEYWDLDQIIRRYGDSEPARPLVCTLVGSRLYLGPTPDLSTYHIKFYHYAKEPALSTNISNQWTTEAPDLIASHLGKTLARYARDTEAATLFAEDVSEAAAALSVQTIVRREAAKARQMGGQI